MKQGRFWILVIFLPVLIVDLFAQDTIPYPSMSEVEPSVSISVQKANGYQYSYIVSNGLGASQDIWEFMVQILSANVLGTAPFNWDVSKATRPNLVAATWGSIDSTRDIGPGSSLSGFQLSGQGLPAIVQFYAVGYIPIPYGEYIPADQTDDIFVNSAQGRTLGPTDPPTPFNALGFLDTIASYITESRTLGWIANDPTKNKYTRLIDSAKANLSSSPARRGTAKAKLDSVLRNVHPDSAAALITSEAYALLRFNTEYVMKKLRCR